MRKILSIIMAFLLICLLSTWCAPDTSSPSEKNIAKSQEILIEYLNSISSNIKTIEFLELFITEESNDTRIFVDDKKIKDPVMFAFTDDLKLYTNCFAVNLRTEEIYQRLSTAGGDNNPVYVRVSPLFEKEKLVEKLSQLSAISENGYKSMTENTYTIVGDMSDYDGTDAVIFGMAVPSKTNTNTDGAHYDEVNIIVSDSESNHRLNNMYFSGNGYIYLGKSSGTNAYGGTVPVYNYGIPNEVKTAYWNYCGAESALSNLENLYK